MGAYNLFTSHDCKFPMPISYVGCGYCVEQVDDFWAACDSSIPTIAQCILPANGVIPKPTCFEVQETCDGSMFVFQSEFDCGIPYFPYAEPGVEVGPCARKYWRFSQLTVAEGESCPF